MLLGPALAVAFSLIHAALERLLAPRGGVGSLILGVVLGSLTVLPLVLEPGRFEGILYGAFAGGLYAVLVNAPPWRDSKEGGSPR